MTSFAELKRSSKTSLSKLTEEVQKLNKPNVNYGEDDRFWKPTVDKAGNGYAVIRFLPTPNADEVPFTRVWDHGFQGPTGKWYIEKSLTTIGKEDPVSQHNSKLWATGLEENREIARDRKRRLKFISNIYVIKDTAHSENEGKVFLFEYGKKIFAKLNDLMNPEFEGETAVNPFDLWNGATFTLKIRKGDGGFRNYDKSEFSSPCALFDDDDKLEEVFNQTYALAEFTDPSKFKTYEELERKFLSVIGESEDRPSKPTSEMREARPSTPKEKPAEKAPWDEEDEDDEALKYFENLRDRDD